MVEVTGKVWINVLPFEAYNKRTRTKQLNPAKSKKIRVCEFDVAIYEDGKSSRSRV